MGSSRALGERRCGIAQAELRDRNRGGSVKKETAMPVDFFDRVHLANLLDSRVMKRIS
jgi:hypothetical protein